MSDRTEMLKRWHTGRTGLHPSFNRLSPSEKERVLAKAGLRNEVCTCQMVSRRVEDCPLHGHMFKEGSGGP
jgi:hypothetical protein